MAKMKTVQVPKAGADFEIVEREIPQPGAGQHVAQRLILLVGPMAFLVPVSSTRSQRTLNGHHHSRASTRADLPGAGRTHSRQRRSHGPRRARQRLFHLSIR